MKLRLLLTDKQVKSIPNSCEVLIDYGKLDVRFEDGNSVLGTYYVVEDTENNISDWLGRYDNFLVGVGDAKYEQFKSVRIKKKIELSLSPT